MTQAVAAQHTQRGEKPLVMLVMPEEHRTSLLAHLNDCGLDVLPVRDGQTASRILNINSHIRVVLCDSALPDGKWTGLLNAVHWTYRKPEFVVCMRVADPAQWIDALEAGAYDVLVQPFRREEVRRIIAGALGRTQARAVASRRGLVPEALAS
jgi:DNA-binding NtrC family response regulator